MIDPNTQQPDPVDLEAGDGPLHGLTDGALRDDRDDFTDTKKEQQ